MNIEQKKDIQSPKKLKSKTDTKKTSDNIICFTTTKQKRDTNLSASTLSRLLEDTKTLNW